MSPSRPGKSNSRRSSILKPPKPRQIHQHLSDNNSSNENSPANTLKLKRRVSFAEKKHVKEFCNSVEQGTVWDTTYEEHDLSNLKIPNIPNQEEQNVQVVQGVHEENIVNNCSKKNSIQFVFNVTTEKDFQVQNYNLRSRNSLLSQTEMLVNSNNLNATSIQDIHMDFTEVVGHTVYHDTNCIQNNNLEQTIQNTSMELTEPICPLVNVLQNFQENQNIQEVNQSAADQHMAMELTVAVSSINRSIDIANEANSLVYSENNRTKRFDNVSMEITTPVPSVLHRLQQPIDNISMEITTPVPHNLQYAVTNNEIETCTSDLMTSICNKTTIFHNASMEITSAVKADCKDDNEKTEVLNIPMEMTEVVPINIHTVAKSQERVSRNCEITDTSVENDLRKTRSYLDCYTTSINVPETNVYDTEAMELTEAIRTSPQMIEDKTSVNSDKTNVYDNEAMEFTEAVRTSPQMIKDKTSVNCDKSNVYDNEAMEFTEAIRTSPQMIEDKTSVNSDKTNVYDNEAMEFTEAVRTSPQMIKDKTSVNCDKSNVYDNEAMEFTEAIRTSPQMIEDKTSVNCDKSNVYDNEAMEFTEAIRTSPQMIEDKTSVNSDKTNVYDNEAMEFTEAIRTSPQMIEDKTSVNSDKTSVYDNKAMEFTEATRTSPQNNLTSTEHIRNSSPGPWGNSSKNDGINIVLNEITTSQNNSMITANVVLPSDIKDHESNVNNLELIKTMLDPNISMDITEAVVVSQHPFPIKDSVIDSTYIKESVLLKNKDKDSSDINVVHGNVLKDITAMVVASPSEPDLIMDKEMYIGNDFSQSLKNNVIKRTSCSIELENSVGNTSNRALLESDQQDADTLTLKENIKEKTYVLHSSVLYDLPINVTSGINRNECLSSHKPLQNVIPNSRRTYTIHPLRIDHSFNKENNKASDNIDNEIKHDTFCYTPNSNTSCTKNSLNNTNNLQDNNEEYLTEKDAIFFSNTLEGLHSITPPKFISLEDSLDSDTAVDVDVKDNCNSNNKSSGAIEQNNVLENISDIREEISEVNEEASTRINKINNDCLTVDLTPSLEPRASFEPKDESIELDPFSSLINKLKVCAQRDEIIWEVYHENIEKNLFVIGFISSSLLVVIYLEDLCDATSDQLVKEIKIYSRLADDADALISIVHRIIMETLDVQVLADLCKTCDDIFSILDNISKEVKLAMDFMFDVERISDINLMEITRDSVSFIAFAKQKDIILRVTVNIKPFHKIESKDISIHCRLGSVREEDIKRLITNVKRDPKFLHRYINDVNDYIYFMEKSADIIKRSH